MLPAPLVFDFSNSSTAWSLSLGTGVALIAHPWKAWYPMLAPAALSMLHREYRLRVRRVLSSDVAQVGVVIIWYFILFSVKDKLRGSETFSPNRASKPFDLFSASFLLSLSALVSHR